MRRIADLLGHPVGIDITCGCTRVLPCRPEYFLERLGPEATIEESERRMICGTCGQRPTLTPSRDWAVSGGRDRRVDPKPMPDWVPR